MIPIPTRATTTRGWARWGVGGQDLGTAYVVVAEASCPGICHSRPVFREHLTQMIQVYGASRGGQSPGRECGYCVAPDQGLITALPMEVTAVVTAVSSDSVLWSL